jgi:hypothetical protein
MRILNYNQDSGGSPTGYGLVTIPSDTSTWRLILNPLGDSTFTVAVDTSQQISYAQFAGTPTGANGLYCDVKAFFFKR